MNKNLKKWFITSDYIADVSYEGYATPAPVHKPASIYQSDHVHKPAPVYCPAPVHKSVYHQAPLYKPAPIHNSAPYRR